MNNKLIAKISFIDVDGNAIQTMYNHGRDVCDLLEYLGDFITDEYNFHKVQNKQYLGINGIIDITKPVEIVIQCE